MGTILKLSLREMRKSFLWTLLMFVVCVIAMITVVTSITNATSSVFQQKVFEDYVGYDMSKVMHLHYLDTKETDEFAAILNDFLSQINTLDGVESSGRFDQTGKYFNELKDNPDYWQINTEILQASDSKYLNVPGITRVMYVDEAVLKLMEGISAQFDENPTGYIPLFISEAFEKILPLETKITDERTNEIYRVKGYIPRSLKVFDENDLIRLPLVTLDGFFISPFPPNTDLDIMSQLSCLHNTYVFLNDGADPQEVKHALSDMAKTYGIKVSGSLLSEEYADYRQEKDAFVKAQIVLAVFISIMAISSVIAVFTTNTILKKRQYGIMMANGYSRRELIMIITTESFLIVLFSGVLSWIIKLLEIISSKSLGITLFRDVLLTAHLHFALPLCVMVCAVLIILSVLLPAVNIFHYQPSELIQGENVNGTY